MSSAFVIILTMNIYSSLVFIWSSLACYNQEVLKVANKRQTLKEEVDQLQQTRVSKLKESKELVEKLESVKLDISNTLRLAEEKENEVSIWFWTKYWFKKLLDFGLIFILNIPDFMPSGKIEV